MGTSNEENFLGGRSEEGEILNALLKEFRADPEGYEINKKLGLFMTWVRKYQLHAEPHILKALSFKIKDNDTNRLLDALARCHALKGNREACVKVYETAREICPEIRSFDYKLGCALFEAGRLKEASDVFREAVDGCYQRAKENSSRKNGPIIHFLELSSVIRRFFGELAAKLDLYLKARELGLVESEKAILFAPDNEVSNPRLLDYWKQYITVETDPACIEEFGGNAVFIDYYTLPGGLTLHRDLAHRAVQNMWEEEGRAPLLTLKDSDRERGWARLKSSGVPEGAWLASLHVREAGFFDEDVEWSVNRYRNAKIETYLPAIEEIVSRGGWVIRLGDPSMTTLPEMDNVIDYANSDLKSDWMDIFLIAESRFYLGMASGPSSAAVAFGVPAVGTNWFHLGPWPYCKHDIFIHKLLKSTKDGRILSIAESLKPPMFGALEPLFLKAQGVEPVDNTGEEIKEAVVEMLDRLDGKKTYSGADERRQAAYKKQADPYGIPIASRLCGAFLERHPELIGA